MTLIAEPTDRIAPRRYGRRSMAALIAEREAIKDRIIVTQRDELRRKDDQIAALKRQIAISLNKSGRRT